MNKVMMISCFAFRLSGYFTIDGKALLTCIKDRTGKINDNTLMTLNDIRKFTIQQTGKRYVALLEGTSDVLGDHYCFIDKQLWDKPEIQERLSGKKRVEVTLEDVPIFTPPNLMENFQDLLCVLGNIDEAEKELKYIVEKEIEHYANYYRDKLERDRREATSNDPESR